MRRRDEGAEVAEQVRVREGGVGKCFLQICRGEQRGRWVGGEGVEDVRAEVVAGSRGEGGEDIADIRDARGGRGGGGGLDVGRCDAKVAVEFLEKMRPRGGDVMVGVCVC